MAIDEHMTYVKTMGKWMVRKKLVPICPACEGKKLVFGNLIEIPPIPPETHVRSFVPMTCPNCGFIQLFDYDKISLEVDGLGMDEASSQN